MAATLKDISKHTGINVGTISHVLNNRPKADVLRKETRDLILATAKSLGYRRNELAATIRTGVNSTVALIIDFSNDGPKTFANSVISGVLMASTEFGYGVKLYATNKLDICFQEIESHCIKHIVAETVDLSCRQRLAKYCRENDLQLSYIFEKSCEGFPAVASDDRKGICEAVKLLVNLGHRRIALICSKHTFNYMDERHNGYLEGLKEADVDVDNRLVDCSKEIIDNERAIRRMLDLPPESRPTAFCCIADSQGLLVERVAAEKGLSIPDDISVVGFSNSDNIDCALSPLTSIAQPFEEMGKTALKLVLGEKCSVKPTADNRYLLPVQLIKRDSIGPYKK